MNHYVSADRVWPMVFWRGKPPRRILLSRAWVSQLCWAMRPGWLKGNTQKKKRLFAGPWVGEFGWELMNWQGLIRALRPYYEHITVCAGAQSAALYADCCDEFIAHHIRGQSNAHVVFDMANPDELRRVLALVPPEVDHLKPLRHVPLEAQRFIRFGEPEMFPDSAEILIHARANPLTPGRNWSAKKWMELLNPLQAQGLRVGAVGLSGSTLDIKADADYRDRPLEETIHRMACARMVMGPSSGPMHLASLCGTPHLVWTDRRTYSMRRRSRALYETFWNPLRTPVSVLDEYGFDPPVQAVLTQFREVHEANVRASR